MRSRNRFPDQAKFPIFEVAQTSVDDACGGCAGSGTEVGLVDKEYIDSLQREFTEEPDAIDPGSNDQYRYVGGFFERAKFRA